MQRGELRLIWTRSFASRLESGSSKRKTLGLRTIARPTATRCLWAARERLRLAVQELFDIEDLGGFVDAGIDLGLGILADLQAESHVVVNGHMGVQRVVLEHHRDVRSFGATSFMSLPSMYSSPPEISSRPATMRSVVVLPQPDGPTRTTNSLSLIVRLALSTALTPPS